MPERTNELLKTKRKTRQLLEQFRARIQMIAT